MKWMPEKWSVLQRVVLHIPMGQMWVVLWLIEPWAAAAMCILFVIYELNEDLHLRDGAYIDLAGSMIGLVAATLWYRAIVGGSALCLLGLSQTVE